MVRTKKQVYQIKLDTKYKRTLDLIVSYEKFTKPGTNISKVSILENLLDKHYNELLEKGLGDLLELHEPSSEKDMQAIREKQCIKNKELQAEILLYNEPVKE